MLVGDRGAAVLAVDEVLDQVHRAREVEGHHRDDVLDALGLEALERVPHARRLQLEHPEGAGLAEELLHRAGLEVMRPLRERAAVAKTGGWEQDKIGAVIGPSGKNIKWIIEQTGADININDDGMVSIYCMDKVQGELARKLVSVMAGGVQPGDVWEAKIVKILDGVGAIAEIIPGQSGLVHISQISQSKVNDINDFLKIGQAVTVKVISVDPFKGRISLSMKDLAKEKLATTAAAQ